MISRLDTVLAAVVLAAAVCLAGAAMASRADTRLEQAVAARGPERVTDWRTYATGGHLLGPSKARVIITVFSDYQCPFCRSAFGALEREQARHPGEVAVIYRHFPLTSIHPNAYAAALASECASAEHRFNEYHRGLFEHPRVVLRAKWAGLARVVHIADTAVFNRCIADHTYDGAVQADVAAATRLGVSGTPTILVNGWRMHAPAVSAALDSLVVIELAGAGRN